MARADRTGPGEAPAAPQHYGTIVVVGGGCYGSYYVRQLRRAREREALTWERLIVVDHDEDCAVAREHPADLELAVSDWSEFFAEYLGGEAVHVDRFGTADSFAFNVAREYERNGERYQLLRWAQRAFTGLRVVPPGTGIAHQVNLEFLASVVTVADVDGRPLAYPDTLVGTDSHTTMINALGVLGYGGGGIEAEAVLLGPPRHQPMPRIVGVR